MPSYSVLMSVYYKENPDYLRIAMNSIWAQTAPTDDFVLVCDGPLTNELESVIEDMNKIHSESLNVVRLEKNGGLGKALNEGIKHCKHNLIARMDSDDISRPDRCEKQLAVFQEMPEVSICSGTVEEFSVSTDTVDARRILPERNEDIVLFSKERNPFNHPCVMYRKSAIEEAGGYKDFYLLEDYFLWIRAIQSGAVGYNLQEPLLWMRAGIAMYKRRSGIKYVKSQKALFKYMKETGFITNGLYLKAVFVRSVLSLIPNVLRQRAYKAILRKK